MKQQAAKGHTAKHSHTKKHHHHHHHKKHHPTRQVQGPAHHHQKVHVAAKGAKGAKPRGLALGAEVACCTAEALAASLRLTGRPVSAQDVLTLYGHTADGPDAFVSIEAALNTAAVWGLAGVRPVSFQPVELGDPAALILGVDLPGAHTVCAAGGGWWSWGELWCPWCGFPDAVAEEAWVVSWP